MGLRWLKFASEKAAVAKGGETEDGEADVFVDFVYDAFDKDGRGMNFNEFISGLAAASKGSMKKKLVLSFQTYDVFSTGKIEKEEMRKVLCSLYRESAKLNELLEDIYDSFDKDHSDALSYMEYVQAILAHPNLADFSLTEEQQHSLDAVDDARNQKDSKGSIQSTIARRQNDLDSAEENFSLGSLQRLQQEFQEAASISGDPLTIEKDAFRKVLENHDVDWRSESYFDRIFATFDTEGTASISYSEFIVGLAALLPDKNPREKLEFAFSIFDVDGSGKITKEEMVHVLRAWADGSEHGNVKTTEFVDKVFSETDKDGSKGLSLREFINASLKFEFIFKMVK